MDPKGPVPGDRKGYYARPGVRVTVPGVLFSVAIQPAIREVPGHPDWLEESGGVIHAWAAKRRRGRWCLEHHVSVEDAPELLDWMHRHGDRQRRNYVVCPNASDVMTTAGLWPELVATGVQWCPMRSRRTTSPEDGVCRVRRLVTGQRCDIIDYSRYGYRWVWVSGKQYLPMPEDEVARSMSIPWIDTGDLDPATGDFLRSARERSYLWLRAVQQLSDWWAAHAKAPWALTAGQMAVGMLRTHMVPRSICTHKDQYVHKLERAGAFGGRATTFYFGAVGCPKNYAGGVRGVPSCGQWESVAGPAIGIDYRSMYPSLLRDQRFPVKLIGYSTRYSTRELMSLAEIVGVVASVTIRTRVPEYPYRYGERVLYPVGRFPTVLTGPELLRLRQDGDVEQVHEVATYAMGTPFEPAARELIMLRERYRDDGSLAWEYLCKLIANSLGGKLAQKTGQWVERRKMVPRVEWGEWLEGCDGSGRGRRYRAIAGLVWEWARDKTGSGPHTAAFDYLTAYGRLAMRRVREACPRWTVLSMDTDGLWVLPAAVDAIRAAGYPFGDRAGQLRITEVADAARWYGPRHYWTPAGWVLSGFTDPRMLIDGQTIDSTVRVNPIRSGAGRPPTGVLHISRRSMLKLDIPGGTIDSGGWWHPRVMGTGQGAKGSAASPS